jgi:DNA-directed RNA polymerase sigma subunit (sigma70/sigma32)
MSLQKSPEAIERIEEMKRLRFEEKWTLQQIADKYGICRERVRQLIGNTGRLEKDPYTTSKVA